MDWILYDMGLSHERVMTDYFPEKAGGLVWYSNEIIGTNDGKWYKHK